MKAKINYNTEKRCIFVKITHSNRTLADIEETAKHVKKMQEETNAIIVFYDHSDFKWEFDYMQEYSLAKNLPKFLPFRKDTKIAFYLGNYYDEKYWKLMEKIIADNSEMLLKYFGNIDEANKWLFETA